jgi:hypothetical protein
MDQLTRFTRLLRDERLGPVPHIPAHEAERRRALRLYRKAELFDLRFALKNGCYSEIMESVRSTRDADERDELIHAFFANYPKSRELSIAVARYVTASIDPQPPRFVSIDKPIDWRTVATGARASEGNLRRRYQNDERALLWFESLSGVIHAAFEPFIRRVSEAAMSSGANGAREVTRLELDMRRTCELAAVEMLFGAPDGETNWDAIEQWCSGTVRLWPSIHTTAQAHRA